MFAKRIFDVILSLLFLLVLAPLIALIAALVRLSSKGPVIFKQKRVGIMKKIFTMYKFRTMYLGAGRRQKEFLFLNEANGPVFKITNDPRYTKFGKLLAHTGLDELPQLVNVISGQMSLVGPRPLPIDEAKKVPDKYKERFSVLPGITSSWIVKGSHKMAFDDWMKLDLDYIKDWSLWRDIRILYLTWPLMLKWICKSIFFWL